MIRALHRLVNVLWWLAATYVCWFVTVALVVLWNSPIGLLIAIWWPVVMIYGFAFFPGFLLPPAAASLAMTCALAVAVLKRRPRQWWWPIALNLVCAASFFGLAEGYRAALMHGHMLHIRPDRTHVHSFLRSVKEAGHGPAHAEIEKNGVRYIWSYSELKFVPAKP